MQRKKISIIVLLTVIYFFQPHVSEIGFSDTSSVCSHFTYQFYHASILHLITNCIAFYVCLNERVFSVRKSLLIAYTISVICSFFLMRDIPTVGLSGLVFALLGITYGSYVSKYNTLMVAICVAPGFFMPNVNAMLHLYCLMVGFTISLTICSIRRYNEV